MDKQYFIKNLVNENIKKLIDEGMFEDIADTQPPVQAQPQGNAPEPDYDKVELGHDPKVRSGKEWADKGGNFPVVRNGKTFYVSRSSVVSMKCFCRNRRGEWCILANQRGPGAGSNIGAWNTPVGYLDYGETFEEAAARETFEETGVRIPLNKIQFMGMDSKPVGSKQDVVIRFGAVLDGVIDKYPTSDKYSEPGEVSDIQWIPLSRVKDKQYKWNGNAQLYHASAVLGDYNGKHKNSTASMIAELRRELNGNPKATYLFNQILRQLAKK